MRTVGFRLENPQSVKNNVARIKQAVVNPEMAIPTLLVA